jgi:Polysaccharide lyase/Bacterial Ig domain
MMKKTNCVYRRLRELLTAPSHTKYIAKPPARFYKFRRALRSVTGITLLAGGSTLAQVSWAELDYNIDFESDSVFNTISCSGNCPTVSSQYAREGRSSLKSSLNRRTSEVSFRTEMKVRGGMTGPQKMTWNRDYWIGFSILLPRGWTHSGDGELLAQVHGSPNNGVGTSDVPFEIRAGRGDWQIWTRGAGGKLHTLNSAYEDVGRWVDWVVHYRPSYNGNGVIRVWKDGALVLNEGARSNTRQSNIGPYWKMGVYAGLWKDRNCCNGSPEAKVVYHDALRIASGPNASYADVAPRGGVVFEPESAPSDPEPQASAESGSSPGVGSESDSTSGSTSGSGSSSGSTSEPIPAADSFVGITNLNNYQDVKGLVDVTIEARDPDGIRKVVFWVDKEIIGELMNPPYKFSFDSRPLAGQNGVRLKAVAFDNNGDKLRKVTRVDVKAESEQLSESWVPAPDERYSSLVTEPYIGITNLTNHQVVEGRTVEVLIDAQAPEGIRKVVFWVGDTIIGTLKSPPYKFVFNSRPLSGQKGVRLKAVAFDNSGNKLRKVTRVNVE